MAKQENVRNVGLDVKAPKTTCDDSNCPFHGTLSLRGRSFTGTVVSTKMSKSVKVQWETRKLIPKYERYERRKKKITAHKPGCIPLEEGDVVVIKECRPLSKTKNFCVIKKVS